MSDTTLGRIKTNYIPELDGFRAISVIIVMLHHFERLSVGWIGVQFFFVLSGYLITKGLLSEKQGLENFGTYIKLFYLKRVLRIFPIYFLYVFCFLIYSWLTGDTETAKGTAIPLLTYTMNIYAVMPNTVNLEAAGYLWSLSAEEQFYLIWPLVVFFTPDYVFKRLLYAIIVIIPICRLFLFYTIINRGNSISYSGAFVYLNTLSQFDAFAVGAIIVYFTDVRTRSIYPLRKLVFSATFIFLAIGQINLYFTNGTLLKDITTFGYRVLLTGHYQYVWGYTVINLFAAVVIFAVVSRENVVPFLKHKIMIYIGKISYGMYVLHMPILLALDGLKNKGLLFTMIRLVLFFAITILLSHFSFKYFESYFMRLKKKYQAAIL